MSNPTLAAIAASDASQAQRTREEEWHRQRLEERRREHAREYVGAHLDEVLDKIAARYNQDPREELGELLARHGRLPQQRRTA